MRERQLRLARSRTQQEAIDHNHLLRQNQPDKQMQNQENSSEPTVGRLGALCDGGGGLRTELRNKSNASTPARKLIAPIGRRLLFAATTTTTTTCCLVVVALLLVISSDFPRGAATASNSINQTTTTTRATPIRDKNVIKLAATSTTETFNGATSQLANKQRQQRQPPTRTGESNDHHKRATTMTTIDRREQQFGAQKSRQSPVQRPIRLEQLAVAPTTRTTSKSPPPPPQLFKYHLNHSRPPPLVPITIQQQQQQQQPLASRGNLQPTTTPLRAKGAPNSRPTSGAETKTINRTRATGEENNRAGGGGDLLMAASELDGRQQSAVASGQQQLVQLQLPLELHLKLKPLPLPMPPPPSIRQVAVVESKHRRALTDGDESKGAGRAQVPTTTNESVTPPSPSISTTTTPSSLITTTRAPGHMMMISNRHSLPGDLQALTWQEAKRVLMMNSIAPPLVQAAQRRIERRHLLMVGGHAPPPLPTISEQPLSSNHLFADVGVQQVVDNSLHTASGSSSPSLKFQEFFPSTSPAAPIHTKPATTVATTRAKSALGVDNNPVGKNSGALIDLSQSRPAASSLQRSTAGNEGTNTGGGIQQNHARLQPRQQGHAHHHEQARLSSMHRIELNEFLNAKAATSTPTAARQNRPVAAAPSSATAASTRAIDERESRIQQMAAAMLPFVWPSFQLTTGHAHLGAAKLRARSADSTRTTTTSSPSMLAPTWPMKYHQLDRTTSGVGSSPAEASEFRPTFADQDQPVVGTTTTTTTSTTTTTARPTTTTTTERPKETPRRGLVRLQQQPQLDARSSRKRRRKSGAYLQQQQERLERQSLQLQLNKKAKKTMTTTTSKPDLSKELGPQTTTPPLSTEGPLSSDSTRLASRYQMPRLRFNSNRTHTEERGAGPTDERRAAHNNSPKLVEGRLARNQEKNQQPQVAAQLPKSLSKLIEQQLAAAAAIGSNSTMRQNLLLLQQYFSQNQTVLPSKAPTTSVSRVVRVQGVGGDLLRVLPANRSETVATTTTTTTTTSTTVPPTPVSVKVQSETEASTERSRKTLEVPPTTTTTTTTTTTERPPATTTSTTTLAPSTQRGQVDAVALELGSNKIAPDASEEDAPPSVAPSAAPVVAATSTVKPAAQSNSGQQDKAQAASQLQKKKKQQQQQQQQQQSPWQKSNRASAAHSARNNKNIKLFHFKRKPDVAKLPFYKKPLNYTELGWTPEEIEREQRRLAELQQLELSSGESESSDEKTGEDDEQSRETATTSKPASGPLTIGQASGDLSLLKRKRRAKNQFERLMAELQAAAALAANGTTSTTTTELPPPPGAGGGRASGQPVDEEQEGEEADEAEEPQGQEVPAVRKKTEPLVMKPMFFVTNQKRRRTKGQAGNQTAAESGQVNSNSTREIEESSAHSLETSRSKPIVRLRRKHHGEQPEVVGSNTSPRISHLELEPVNSPWRPSGGPTWSSPSHTVAGQRLLLVPSGLLTPSGSHPMPLFAPSSMNLHQATPPVISSAWLEQQASAPASQPTVSSVQQEMRDTPAAQVVMQPAPLTPQVASLVQAQQQAQMGANSELRVPKLLVKPMRPAKYSLNGYIPKPSLVNQMRQHQAPAPAQTTPASNLMQVAGSIQPTRAQVPGRDLHKAKQSPLLRPSAQHKQQQQQQQKRQLATASGRQPAGSGGQNKDLDSSTSNEIFSRRRGLQKASQAQPRSSSAGISFEALLARSSQPEVATLVLADLPQADELTVAGENRLQPPRNQMEENRRKYVRQHQQTFNALKSVAPLSAQRANQIKAKLGLVISPNSIRPRPERTGDAGQTGDQETGDLVGAGGHNKLAGRRKWSAPDSSSASTNSVATLDPDAALELAIAGGGQQLTAGSGAYHTIPKTDFECTNKRGHFVSGLFADFKTGCRVWHLCSNNRKYSFLCPTGTIFNAKVRICDWRYNVKCENEPPI